MQEYTVSALHAEKRIDKVLRQIFPSIPMSALFKHLRVGKIKLNKKKVKPEKKVEEGDVIQCYIQKDDTIQKSPPKRGVDFEVLKKTSFYKNNCKVLYEDNDVLALEKPAGIAVHPGSKHYHGRTMLDIAQAYANTEEDEFQTTLVHRLDLETSGVLLFAKNPESLRNLNEQMKKHSTEKIYYALCRGNIKKDSGTIRLALERTEGKSRSTKIVVSRGGREAKQSITHFEVLKRFGDKATLIKVKLETGRMHQIRVHMKSQGHALWGDPHYGDFKFNRDIAKEPYSLKRMFLHAYSLTFKHPKTGKDVSVQSELTEDLRGVLEELKKSK